MDKVEKKKKSEPKLDKDGNPKISKKEATEIREATASKLKEGLELKKKLVELWEKHNKDPTTTKGITSPETLLQVLEDVGFMQEVVKHIGQRKRWKISDGRTISAVNLSAATKNALAQMLFNYMDLDGDHSISINELLIVLNAMADPDEDERSKFHFLMMDADGNGQLDADELTRLFALHALAMKVAFEVDLMGFVADRGLSDELANLARKKMSEAVFDNPKFVEFGRQELLSSADTNKDGTIQLSEWLKWTSNEASLKRFAEHVKQLVEPLLNYPEFKNNKDFRFVINRSIEALILFF